jgi:mRNA interferase MazF
MSVRHPFQRGDVVLVSFPFSNASGQKERPAVVLSTDDYYEEWNEVIVVAITSRQPKTLRKTDCELKDWHAAGLKQRSWVRSHLATVHYQLIVRKIEALSQRDLQAVEQCLRVALGL